MTEFFWGNSTSSMQTEGGWNEGGKSLSVYDIRKSDKHSSDWHVANDNYHNFEEDLDYMHDLGMNMYRFQISWSRIIKDGDGEINEEGFKYYDNLVDGLIARNIEPMVCLYHFDMPLHLAQEYNGFISKKVCEAFIRYAKIVINHFGNKVKYWLTFNEQNIYHTSEAFKISGYLKGDETLTELYQISHNVMYCHAAVANYLHNKISAKIGGMLAYSQIYPATSNPKDVFAAHQIDEFLNYNLLDVFTYGKYSSAVKKFVQNNKLKINITAKEMKEISRLHSDFLSFSYYSSSTIASDKIPKGTAPNQYLDFGMTPNQYLESTEWGWQIDPTGFRDVLNKIYQRYHLPVFPIENGIGVRETWDGIHQIKDDYRINYLRNHILAMQAAMNEDGVDVIGYLGWGLIDIMSSQGDMDKRYGVVYVNRTNHDLRDMKRVPKKSYEWLKKVIHSNGKDLIKEVNNNEQ
ncbi:MULTISPECIES: glycoside hydrolase family 1 protein [unclassified Lactobacillus]|uniref:glycoside hydrolase family 1 protein n=1 Tax=unclassified Lactobacillus TaxID=2620435 RepID=UPI000EFA4666|nr:MULTISPECIES: glycoside hydrolase family 1 protein [unclassified Lactobacillus]RMC24915.1 glycoside hydrolase family 1 protein [Lactobacillus sp. ESL0247]RMC29070.1 glycoside hydrolase family 1 protein [Lactobacillus sp. ESL0246]RMC32673.1 glycoside hydrolase family 1 protein [Lactobacillus sp. ESL0245]